MKHLMKRIATFFVISDLCFDSPDLVAAKSANDRSNLLVSERFDHLASLVDDSMNRDLIPADEARVEEPNDPNSNSDEVMVPK